MSRRVSLPGADELFRNTATLSAVPSSRENTEEITQAPQQLSRLKILYDKLQDEELTLLIARHLAVKNMMKKLLCISPPMNFMI